MEDVSISVYPNPARDYINVTLPLGSESFELVDILGRIARSSELKSTSIGLKLSLQGLEEGIYNLIVHIAGGNVLIRKIIVAR
jgi:hypothetical protein